MIKIVLQKEGKMKRVFSLKESSAMVPIFMLNGEGGHTNSCDARHGNSDSHSDYDGGGSFWPLAIFIIIIGALLLFLNIILWGLFVLAVGIMLGWAAAKIG